MNCLEKEGLIKLLLDKYMRELFPDLQLRPPLYYKWAFSLRFELGENYDADNIYENCPYLTKVYKRAVTLFESLHSSEDDIYIVVDVDDFGYGEIFQHKLNIFSKYINKKAVLARLKQHIIPYIFSEDDADETFRTHRFFLKCKTSDVQYIPMLKAICNQDMGIRQSISYRTYFINANKDTIFHIYDDRGCDLLATSRDGIQKMYEEYNDWILDYDREGIDNIFKKDS